MKSAVFAVIVGVLSLTAGCGGQVPASNPPGYNVDLTWTASVSCTPTTCVYAVYRATTTGGTCPSTTTAAWAEITTTSTRPTASTYTDGTATGMDICYDVEAVETGVGNSGPSNVVNFSVPSVIGAPILNTPTTTVSMLELPPQPPLKFDVFQNGMIEIEPGD